MSTWNGIIRKYNREVKKKDVVEKLNDIEIEIEKIQEELLYFKRRTVLHVAGWEFSAVSLYDEEGVEGWHWESPKGEDFYEMGDWDDPAEIPEEVVKIADELIN